MPRLDIDYQQLHVTPYEFDEMILERCPEIIAHTIKGTHIDYKSFMYEAFKLHAELLRNSRE
jgi:hypothetical protein